MTAIAVLVLAAAVLAFVLAPLRRPIAERWQELTGGRESLLTERDALYRTLRELDFDRQLGNVEESDYRELSERYRRRAAQVLRALDAHADEPQRAVQAPRSEAVTDDRRPATGDEEPRAKILGSEL